MVSLLFGTAPFCYSPHIIYSVLACIDPFYEGWW